MKQFNTFALKLDLVIDSFHIAGQNVEPILFVYFKQKKDTKNSLLLLLLVLFEQHLALNLPLFIRIDNYVLNILLKDIQMLISQMNCDSMLFMTDVAILGYHYHRKL